MTILKMLIFLLPWPLRRLALNSLFGYRIHRHSHIGLAWIFPKKLVMEAHSKIGHLTVCKEIDLLQLGAHASIGRLNWITGFPGGPSTHFAHQPGRTSSLIVEDHASITHRHLVDCTSTVSIGAFTTFAGFRSQILTHSIELANCRQSSEPISIGKYCFVGTDCVLLGGCALPDNSVLGAKSLLNKSYSDTYWLYAGTPAKPVKQLNPNLAFFSRRTGFVQ
jgi:acetyltransferase-like isoleucine patch superfamily enzyme